MQLAQCFAECYAQNTLPQKNNDRIIESIDEFPAASKLNLLTKCIVNSANRKWRKAGKRVIYSDYQRFEEKYITENPLGRTIVTISGEEYDNILNHCKKCHISVNDYLVAKMMTEEKINKVIIGANIRKYIEKYENGSLGNFSSAYSVVDKGELDDVYGVALKVKDRVGQIQKRPDRELIAFLIHHLNNHHQK